MMDARDARTRGVHYRNSWELFSCSQGQVHIAGISEGFLLISPFIPLNLKLLDQESTWIKEVLELVSSIFCTQAHTPYHAYISHTHTLMLNKYFLKRNVHVLI